MTSKQTYSICIIDDDPFLLDMYNLKFQQAGHAVQCFTEGEQGLNAIRENKGFDAILLDIVMPQVSGYDILQTVREENLCSKDTAIIILSNQGQDKDIEQAKAFGIDGYLVKANTLPSEVLEQVETIIGKKHEASS